VIPEQAAQRAPSVGPNLTADFLSLAETLSSFIALVRRDRVIYVNPAGCALLGRPKDHFVGVSLYDVIHPDDREPAMAREEAALAGVARPERLSARLLHADGRTIWIECSLDVICFQGQPTTLVTGNDVTERRRMEKELRKSEARLAEAQRIGHIGSWEMDIPGNRITWSDELCRIYGVDPSAFGGNLDGYLSLVHPEDRAVARERIEKALRTGGPFAFEHRVVHPDGAVRTIFGQGEVFLDANAQPVRAAGTGQDITERRRMEEDLRASEARFRNLCMQAPVMLLAFDPCGRVRDVSHFWLQTMGYRREEVVGQEGWDFITPDTQARLRAAIEENQRNNETVIKNFPLQAVRKDGTTIDLLATSVAEIGDCGEEKGAICVQVNLTDLQRAEAALRESEERYRALVEHAPEAIMVIDVDKGLFVDANAHAEKLFGYSREKILTMGPLDFCSEHQDDGRESCDVIEDEHKKVLEGEEPVFEFTHIDSQGREIQCQTRMSRLPAAGRRLIRASTTDITELKQLQEKMRHADKLAAAGALAAGVAHEIGNPLMALSMAAQSLERRTCDEYTQKKLTLIREHCERIGRIVRQMSELARPQSGQKARCDLNHLVRRAVEMVRYDKRANGAEIRYEMAEELPSVLAVDDQLTQVCINLALNAFDAMSENPPDRPRRLTIRSKASGSAVSVSFTDTGPGVAPEARGMLFEPFYTTKSAGRGSGLGLSVSYRILEEHEGLLRFEDGAEGGATFTFELPRTAAS
jgi:PAS domain S-box-containing protein